MPPITLRPNKAKAVLLAGAGWEEITLGSLRIEAFQVNPNPASDSSGEDFGFTYKSAAGEVTGRITALLAIRE